MRIRTYVFHSLQIISLVGTVLAIGKFHALFIGDYDLTGSSRFWWILLYCLLCYVVAYSFGLPETRNISTRWKSSLAASAVTSVIFVAVQTAIAQIVLPRFLLALSIPAVFLALFAVSTLSNLARQQAASRERVLLVCGESESNTIRADVDFHVEVPCIISATIDPGATDLAKLIEEALKAHEITLMVVSDDVFGDLSAMSTVTAAHSTGVRVRTVLAFYTTWIGKIPVRELESAALLFDIREIHHIGYARVSRIIDISVALFGLLALALVTPIVMVANLVGNRGPLMFGQDRVGRGQSVFKILKFRTMKPGSSKGEWTQKDDVRVTPFGKFLRRSHLDELPQVVNILRGDLSIVGPRPEQAQYVEQLTATIPYYNARHLVRPGLTGWAQVNYPYGADEIDAFEKLQYEFWYLQHQSLTVDLRVIARTFRHVLGFKGR